MKIALFVLLVVGILNSNSFAQIPEYKEFSLPRNGQSDSASFAFLKSELQHADIVLLGEPSHSPQYYSIKIQLVKYLHEQLNFDVLAFESGLYQMETANAAIKKGDRVDSAFARGLFSIWTSSDEFQEIYPYLGSLKLNNDLLDITGFDCQISGTYASRRFVIEFEAALNANHIPLNKKALQILHAQFESLETGRKGLTEDFDDVSISALKELASSISSVPALSIFHQSLVSWIGHFSDLYYNRIFEKVSNGSYGGKDSNVRDSLMAMNMIYLREHLYPGKKIVGWGANLHFGNEINGLETGSPDLKLFLGMGYYLKKYFDDRVFFLAVTADSNYPHTIETELSEKGAKAAWISRAAMHGLEFSSSLLGKPSLGKWDAVVDGILYFNPTEELHAKANDGYFLKGRILSGGDNEPVSFASFSLDGTTMGTASGSDGEYLLKIDSMDLERTVRISSIGFKTKVVPVRTLMRAETIYLTPEVHLLKEVLVQAKALDAREILQLAIDNISENYLQTPFRMEFYAVNTTLDTVANRSFVLESVFSSYYDGYYKAARKNYRIQQKRETGDYYMKEKTHGMSQWPMWEVAFNDIFSNQTSYQIVLVESLDKIEPKLTGTQIYDRDTVFVIQYNYRVAGTIYISSKDYAILKHVTTSSGKGYRNRTEILYKKQDGKYFPYAANGDYLHQYKVDGVKKMLKISNRTRLVRIEINNVAPFEHNQGIVASDKCAI